MTYKSDIVCPLIIRTREGGGTGVFNLDCLAQDAFDNKRGLEKIALAVDAYDCNDSPDSEALAIY